MSRSTYIVVGIDVGRSALDADILPGRFERHFENDECGRRSLRNWLLQHGVSRAVFEPTGRYHRHLHQCLCEVGPATALSSQDRCWQAAPPVRA